MKFKKSILSRIMIYTLTVIMLSLIASSCMAAEELEYIHNCGTIKVGLNAERKPFSVVVNGETEYR